MFWILKFVPKSYETYEVQVQWGALYRKKNVNKEGIRLLTTTKLVVKKTQLKTDNIITIEARPPRRLAYIPGAAVERYSKRFNLSAALPSRRLRQLWYLKIYSDGPQFASVICPVYPAQEHPKCPARGPVYPISMRYALCCILPREMRFLR